MKIIKKRKESRISEKNSFFDAYNFFSKEVIQESSQENASGFMRFSRRQLEIALPQFEESSQKIRVLFHSMFSEATKNIDLSQFEESSQENQGVFLQ